MERGPPRLAEGLSRDRSSRVSGRQATGWWLAGVAAGPALRMRIP